jgi:formiminotetrahydrofolate cyclodeaminase
VSDAAGAGGGTDTGSIDAAAVGRYLAELASAAPAPGGGSAAAVAAALGAGLVAMTCRVTTRHAGDAHGIGEVAERADDLRRRLITLADDDARAYACVIAAHRLPTPERQAAVQATLEHATEVPARVAATSRDVLALGERIAPCARASTLSDLGVAAILAHGALGAAALTARMNLAWIAAGEFKAETSRQVDALVAEGRQLAERIEAALAARGTGAP